MSTRPPASLICPRGAIEVENTAKKGTSTAKHSTVRTTALMSRSEMPGAACPRPRLSADTSGLLRRVDAGLTEQVGELVGTQDQRDADDALDQSDRRGHPPVPADHSAVVDVRVEHFGLLESDSVLLQQDLFEADGERGAELENEQEDHHALESGKGDVQHLSPAARAVHRSCFIKLGIDSRESGEKDDRGPAGVLPDHL